MRKPRKSKEIKFWVFDKEFDALLNELADNINKKFKIPKRQSKDWGAGLINFLLSATEKDAQRTKRINKLYRDLLEDLIGATDGFTQGAVVPFLLEMETDKYELIPKLQSYLKRQQPKYWKEIHSIRVTNNRLIIER